MKYNAEEINRIVGLKGVDGKEIDIFDLHGVLFVGNSVNGTYDLTKAYVRFSEHSLGISLEYFEECETEEDVNEKFMKLLKEAVVEKLV